MKKVEFNEDKNKKLLTRYGINFDTLLEAIEGGIPFKIIRHPNRERYPHQKMLLIKINEYVYVAPLVEDEEKIFLKTLYPSRKYTKNFNF